MGTFSINVSADKDTARVSFLGTLDEESDLFKLNLAPYRTVTFDLKGLDRVNSRGLRLWLTWIASLDTTRKYFMENLPKVMVTQANMVKGVFPAMIKVKSLDLPYFCDRCQIPFTGTVHLDEHEKISGEIRTSAPCPTCKQSAEIDATDTYFRFLENR